MIIKEKSMDDTIKSAVGNLLNGIDPNRGNIEDIRKQIRKRFNSLLTDIEVDYNIPQEVLDKMEASFNEQLEIFINNMKTIRRDRNKAINKVSGVKLKTELQQFYTDKYPTDDLGWDIDPYATFEDLLIALDEGNGKRVYELCADDSVVRERLFAELANILGVDYDTIYDKWMQGRY